MGSHFQHICPQIVDALLVQAEDVFAIFAFNEELDVGTEIFGQFLKEDLSLPDEVADGRSSIV